MAFSSIITGMQDTPNATSEKPPGQDLAEALHRLLPIHFFYERNSIAMPDFQFLDGKEVPYPYRSLLVHDNDMTPTLAAFHHSKLYLEVHEVEKSDDYLMRLVTLHAAASDIPVEFGAIGIQLNNMPEEIRELVAGGEVPLGGILGEYQVEHHGSPSAFFSVPADETTAKALKQDVGETLYGRCNQLINSEGLVMADIVEILPRSSESERWIGNVK